MFRNALYLATYKSGQPGKLTDAHKRAEHHRFKSELLFKKSTIPLKPYTARVVQQFVMIRAIESHLQNLSVKGQAELNAFFSLAYLNELWRTLPMEKDLKQLNIDPSSIKDHQLVKSTQDYLEKLKQLTPKELLAHFLLHVSGFMHGGNIIKRNHINPSNQITRYQLPTHQYDFFSAAQSLGANPPTSLALFNDLMNQVDKIELDKEDYERIVAQCTSIYTSMSAIYDDLYTVHNSLLQQTQYTHFILCLGAITLALALVLETCLLDMTTNQLSPG